MKKIALVLFIIGATIFNIIAQNSNVALVWQGFEHSWTYNHRLNRLGDYIEQSQFDGYPHRVKHFHTGATGTGKDIASFQSYYSVIKANNIGVKAGEITFQMTGRENNLVAAQQTVIIDATPDLANKDNIAALFNGFDFVSEQGADKLKMFKVDFSDPIYNASTNKIKFDIQVSTVLNCGSLECARFSNIINYEMSIHYVVIAGNKEDFHAQEKTYFKTYEWDKKQEAKYQLINQETSGVAGYEAATLGFKSFQIQLDREHWMAEWHSSIHQQNYNPKTGKIHYSLDLLFRQWKQDMKKLSPYKGPSKFSKKKAGWIYFGGSVLMLQFKNACVEQKSRIGTIQWDGMGKSPSNFNAISAERFKIIDGCKQ